MEYTFIDFIIFNNESETMFSLHNTKNPTTVVTISVNNLVLQADVGAEAECLAGGLDNERLDRWVTDGLGHFVSE